MPARSAGWRSSPSGRSIRWCPGSGSASACIRRGWSRCTSGSPLAGTLIYVFAMWNSGIIQGLMWRTYNESGTLAYSFVDSLVAMYPYYIARAFGGLLFLLGAIVAAYNIWMTVAAVPRRRAAAVADVPDAGLCPRRRGQPGGVTIMPNCFTASWNAPPSASSIAIIAAASIGGLVEIAPLFTIHETVEEAPDMRLYTPLELAGRNIYIREGCYACHTQMIRTLRDEVERYGPYSLAVKSKYDHPMLWGSKRTGPDLARIGGKYSDDWHVAHLTNPRDVVPESNMPAYRWLLRTALETEDLGAAPAGAARARRALHRRDDRQRRRRCLRPGGARHARCRGRDQTLRRKPPRSAHSTAWPRRAHRDGRAGRLSAGARPPDRRGAQQAVANGYGRMTSWTSTTTPSSGFAKSSGLFYLIALSICVVVYAYWPSNRKRFDDAAKRSSTRRTGHGGRGTRSHQPVI